MNANEFCNSNQTSRSECAEVELEPQVETHVDVVAEVSGIKKFFAAEEQRVRELQAQEMIRQGVDDPAKLVHSNEGAYDDVIERVRELHAGGRGTYLVAAIRQALKENASNSIPPSRDALEKKKDADYLGDVAPGELLRGSNVGRTHRGGGGGNRVVWRKNPVTGQDEPVQKMGAHPVPSGGGSEGRSRKEKVFPKRCMYQDCVLQYCSHTVHPRGGRETTVTSIRISVEAKARIEATGMALSEFVENMARLASEVANA